MVQINGKYTNVKNENLAEHLAAFGIPEERIKVALSHKPTITVNVEGEKVTIDSDNGTEKTSTNLILNKEVDEPVPLGLVVKSTVTLNGDTLTITSKADSGYTITRAYKFSDTEVVLTTSDNDGKIPTAKRFYKRV